MEKEVLEVSQAFWKAMENADEKGMRLYADQKCQFVHIGISCDLDKEIEFYTSGSFKPTKITFHDQLVNLFNNTAVVLTDCNYTLLINGEETTHHFMVTEVYVYKKEWKLIQFTFTALIY